MTDYSQLLLAHPSKKISLTCSFADNTTFFFLGLHMADFSRIYGYVYVSNVVTGELLCLLSKDHLLILNLANQAVQQGVYKDSHNSA